MSLTAGMLRDDALRVHPDQLQVDIHLPWYRSLPLSCIEQVELTVNDITYTGDQIRVVVDGDTWALADLPEQVDRQWFVQDPATITVHPTDLPSTGDPVAVEVRLATRIPYILIGPGKALTQDNRVRRELIAR